MKKELVNMMLLIIQTKHDDISVLNSNFFPKKYHNCCISRVSIEPLIRLKVQIGSRSGLNGWVVTKTFTRDEGLNPV